MNSNFIFISNIPKCQIQNFSKELDGKLDNKWSKTIYIDDPFSESMDVFIYNPTSSLSHFDKGIERLRRKEENFSQLQVYYVFFPPPNVNVTSLIPEGSIMLPYLIVDSIPKHVEIHDVIGDLPFKASDFKEWDIPFKDDKWIILRLPKSTDEITRNYVLCYLRNKRLPKGILPRVTEVFISEEPRLSKNMIPKIWKSLTITNSYKSNLIFIYDLPSRISSHDIVDALRDIDYRHCKAYVIDVVEQLRLGFISTQKSISDHKYDELMRKLQSVEIEVANLGKLRLNTSEVWLQPMNCDPPRLKKLECDSRVEFVLINYIYLHNLSACLQPADLSVKSPVTFRVNLYHCPDSKQQIGFISVLEMSEWKVNKIIDYLRSLVFDGLPVLVDEMWIKEYDLPIDIDDRRPVHVSRKSTRCLEVVPNRTIGALDILEEVNLDRQITTIRCADEPPPSSNLIKSNILLLLNLPPDFDSCMMGNIGHEGLCLMDASPTPPTTGAGEKIGFLYHRQASDIKWTNFLEKICSYTLNGRRVVAKEIYMMSDETIDLIQMKLPAVYVSNYIFVYNIGADGGASDTRTEHELSEHGSVLRHVSMSTDSGYRCAFVQLRDDLSPFQILEVLRYIRTVKICGRIVCADLIWLANVSVLDEYR